MSATLLDGLIPRFDFGSRHELVVAAPTERVAAAVESLRTESDSSLLVRLLFRLRGLGAPKGAMRGALTAEGFTVLAEEPGREIVFGIAGRFWALRERANLVRVRDAAAFVGFNEPGMAKAALAIRLETLSPAMTRVMTETRVACSDRGTYYLFALYWMIIKPFSGWIRHDMLRGIARRATAADARDGAVGRRMTA